jgi:putative membrane protein insertion efficiency factor
MAHAVVVAPRRALVLLIRVYQRLLSPLMRGRCRYYPSCSEYAAQAIERFGILRGLVLAVWRLLRCNPFSHGGVDLVEDQRLFRDRCPEASPR